jgi:hypothetical protein
LPQPVRGPLNHAFDPDDIRVLQTALEAAWNVMRLQGEMVETGEEAHATRLTLARRIVKEASHGEIRHGRLLMRALDGLIQTAGDQSAASAPSRRQAKTADLSAG